MDPSNPFCNLFGNETSNVTNEAETVEQPQSSAVNVMEQKINGLIENIFSITINRTPQKNKQLVYMEDMAEANPTKKHMNMELLEQALFERILLPNPQDYLIPNNTRTDETDDIASDKVILYLYRSFERLSKWIHYQNDVMLQEEVKSIKQFILRNASTAMKQPDLFENQSLSDQWLELFRQYQDEYEYKCEFLSQVVAAVLSENDSSDRQTLQQIFNKVFDECLRSVKSASLITVEKWILFIIRAFVSDKTNAGLAQLLLEFTTPKPRPGTTNIDGIQYADTLLGQLLCLSILPKKHNGPYEYYENMADAQSTSLTNSLHNYLTLHLNEMHGIFKGFLLVGGDIRNQMLEWIGSCLHANVARGQIWNNAASALGAVKTVPDSFMIGLCAVLLRLCKPLLRPTFKVFDVDASYYAVSDADRKSKSVHMHGVDKETCLISLADENEKRKTANTYSFVTEIFFMTHKAIDLGYRVCTEKFFQMNREMARMQNVYQDVQAQGGAEMAQNMMQALTAQMPKFLCLQKLITEPTNDQFLLQFYEATALWLTRCASKIVDPKNPDNEINANEIKLPIETPPPKCLATIPEFILENIVHYLAFIRHFEGQTIDTDIDTQNNIFTVILVFMGDLGRARNPHLRARLAEGLESLLPKKCASSFSCSGNKSHLFVQHPHRLEIVPNLLNVFVGIEMTGQSVQFEQKFNYRRPMYAIMEYLWEIEEQRQCFKQLAKIAAEQMEAVNPPIFLRFINLLINDAIFLLDESLSNLQQIRTLQNARDNGEWASLPANEREQNLQNMQHLGMLARFDNILGRDTINMLKLISSEVPDIFCHPSMIDRVAAMLNYFLLHLVGPNKRNFNVKDKKEFDFDPAKTVLEICRIYINLEKCQGFCLAISQDGRSYSPQLFEYAEQVLVRIGGGQLVGEISDLAIRVNQLAREEKKNQEALADAPEEYLDPIMSTLMIDPVILPSSKVIVDRTTIARHLLSDQSDPFNRSPLTMDQVKPDVELKAKIDDWIRERKSQRNN